METFRILLLLLENKMKKKVIKLLIVLSLVFFINYGFIYFWSAHFVFAAEYLANPSFTGGTTSWALTIATYDSAYYSDSAGSVLLQTDIGANKTATGSAEQTISSSISSTDTVSLSLQWSKQCVSKDCLVNTIQIDIAKPSAPSTWVTIWSDTSIPAFGNATSWTGPSGTDVSSYFDETGTYKIRAYADLANPSGANVQSLAWVDALALDVVASSGSLDVTAPTTASFAGSSFSFSGQDNTGNSLGTINVADDRGGSPGWSVDATGADWTGGSGMDYDGDGSATGQLTIDMSASSISVNSGSATGLS